MRWWHRVGSFVRRRFLRGTRRGLLYLDFFGDIHKKNTRRLRCKEKKPNRFTMPKHTPTAAESTNEQGAYRYNQVALGCGVINANDIFDRDVEAAGCSGSRPEDGHLLENQDGARLQGRRQFIFKHPGVNRAFHATCMPGVGRRGQQTGSRLRAFQRDFYVCTCGIVQDGRGVAAGMFDTLDARGKVGQLTAGALAQHGGQIGFPYRVPC
jgi:hypothetical protein